MGTAARTILFMGGALTFAGNSSVRGDTLTSAGGGKLPWTRYAGVRGKPERKQGYTSRFRETALEQLEAEGIAVAGRDYARSSILRLGL